MIAIFGEDESDFKTLKEIVWCLTGNRSLSICGRGFGGKGNLLRDCARELEFHYRHGCKHFIICEDSDGDDPDRVRRDAESRIVKASGVAAERCCVSVAVQEIEAWILADIESANQLFPSWRPREVKNPEGIAQPSRELERRSREGKTRPRYLRALHNAQMIQYLDLQKVAKKCQSCRPLRDFVLRHYRSR
jgi:hypothetical protein